MLCGSTCGAIAGACVSITCLGGSGAVRVSTSESGGASGAGAAADEVSSVIGSSRAPAPSWPDARRVHRVRTGANLPAQRFGAASATLAIRTKLAWNRRTRIETGSAGGGLRFLEQKLRRNESISSCLIKLVELWSDLQNYTVSVRDLDGKRLITDRNVDPAPWQRPFVNVDSPDANAAGVAQYQVTQLLGLVRTSQNAQGVRRTPFLHQNRFQPSVGCPGADQPAQDRRPEARVEVVDVGFEQYSELADAIGGCGFPASNQHSRQIRPARRLFTASAGA